MKMQPLILLGLTLPLLILSSFCAEGQVNNDHKIIEFTTEGLCEPLQAYRPWCPPGVPCSTRLSWSDHYLYISSFKGHQRMYKLLMPPRSSGLSTVISAVPTAFEYTENARVIVISRWKNSALTFVTYTYLNDQRQNPLTYSFGKDRDIVDAFCHLGYVYLVIRVKSTVSKVTQYSWSFVEVPIKDMDEFNDVLNYRVINNAETVFNKSKVIDEVKGTFDNGVNITYVISANKFIFIQGGVQFTSTINSFKDVIIVAPSLTDLDAIYKKITPSDICALVLLRLLDQYQNAKIVHYTLGMDLTKADVVVGLPSSCVSGPALVISCSDKDFKETYDNESSVKLSTAGLVFKKYGYAIISALLNKSWLNSKHLPGLLSKFYYFFIAEFDARAHNLSIDPIITDEYLSSIVGIIASKVNLNAESTESLKVWAMQYASKTPVILAPIKESNSNIYMHVNSVMSQCGDNADFQSNFDKSMKDLDTFITGCFSIVFSKYIQSGPFFQAVQFMTEVSLEKFMNATLDEKHKGLIVDKDRQLLCITRKLKFIPYLHDYKEFDSLLYVIHPGPDKTWYVRGVSRVRDSYAVRRPIPQISKIEPRFPELHNQVEFVHHNGHMARVKSFQAALHFAFILVKL